MFKFIAGKILNGQSRTIASAALVLAIMSLASRFLGLARDRLLAGHFGAGDALDIYYAAFRVPDLVLNLLIWGSLSAAFIPVFIGLRDQRGDVAAWRFVNSFLNIFLLAVIFLGILFFIFAPFLMKIITPGFQGEKLSATANLSRIIFLSPVFLGVSAIWGGILQSFKRFLIFSLAPIFYNLGIISGILFFTPRFGVYGLGFGVALGAFAHMAAQLPAIFSLGWRYQFIFDWADSGARRLVFLMAPRVLTLAISQLNFLAITIIASGMAAGTLSIFELSFNIWNLPLGILAASLATAAYPVMSQAVKKENWPEFVKTVSNTILQILFLIIPATALYLVLRAQIVRVILGSGRFDWEATILTIGSLQYLTLGLFAEALSMILVRGFFAVEDTKTPFWLGLASSAARIGGAWFLGARLGVAGLALGYTIGGVIYMILLWIFLRRKIGGLNEKEIFGGGLKIIIASIFCGGAAYASLYLIVRFVDTHTLLGIFAQGFFAGAVGLAVYFFAGLLLKSREMQTFRLALKKRLPWKTAEITEEIVQK